MKFDNYVTKLLEDFNVFPQNQSAPSTGPDQGMTQGDVNNTFPSSQSTIAIPWPKRKKTKRSSKKGHPKGTRSTRRS